MTYHGNIIVTLIDENGVEHKRAVELDSMRSGESIEMVTYLVLVKAGELAAGEVDKLTRGRMIIAPDGGLGMRPH